jgi:hypothetical protein
MDRWMLSVPTIMENTLNEPVEQMLYYATCKTCSWRSDFVEDRDVAVADGWKHEYGMIEAFTIPHYTEQMRCVMITERDT